MASQLKAYMDYNDLHDPLQSAYKTAHSTESALLKVQNDILRTVDQGGVALLVLLDLSAAFDTIDHSILLDRMRHQLGINGVAYHDGFTLILMSHGVQGSILACDGKKVDLAQIFWTFSNQGCPKLSDKPKLIVIQSCRIGKHIEVLCNTSLFKYYRRVFSK